MASFARAGSATAFWDGTSTFNQSTNPGGGVTVSAGGTSKKVIMARGAEQVTLFVTVSAATTVSLEAAHHGALTAEGNEPDASSPPADAAFGTVYYINTPCSITFASAGTVAMIIPDFEPAWVRLRSSAVATITAGFELTGD